MSTPSQDFRATIKSVKEAIATIVGSAAPKAVVIPRLIFDVNRSKWASLLLSDQDLARVHAITIRYNGLDFVDPGFSKVIGSINTLLPFQLIFFHWYEAGTNADNAEERLMDDIVAVTWALGAQQSLGVSCVAGHEGLRTGQILPIELGEKPVLYATSRLRVRLDSRFIRGQG